MAPLPPKDFDYQQVGISTDWLQAHRLTGFAAHWQKNSNIATAFDTWFVNLFPRAEPYRGDAVGGLTTLNFIPSIGTMILGLFAADLLRARQRPMRTVWTLCLSGGAMIGLGWLLGVIGVWPGRQDL